MTAQDPDRRYRIQLDAYNRSIRQNEESIERLLVLTEQLHKAMFGNGKPEESVRYRMAWAESMAKMADRRVTGMERTIKLLIVAIVTNALITITIAILTAVHLLA